MLLMKTIEPPDSHHVSAAVGWMELGDWRSALEDLEKVAPEFRSHPAVLLVEYEASAKGENWVRAAEVAGTLVDVFPGEPQFWIWQAYASRRMPNGGIPLAKDILSKAQQCVPGEPLISYNIGCYECQLGNLGSARQWLEKAFAIGNRQTLKTLALEDRDWEPMWDEIKQI